MEAGILAVASEIKQLRDAAAAEAREFDKQSDPASKAAFREYANLRSHAEQTGAPPPEVPEGGEELAKLLDRAAATTHACRPMFAQLQGLLGDLREHHPHAFMATSNTVRDMLGVSREAWVRWCPPPESGASRFELLEAGTDNEVRIEVARYLAKHPELLDDPNAATRIGKLDRSPQFRTFAGLYLKLSPRHRVRTSFHATLQAELRSRPAAHAVDETPAVPGPSLPVQFAAMERRMPAAARGLAQRIASRICISGARGEREALQGRFDALEIEDCGPMLEDVTRLAEVFFRMTAAERCATAVYRQVFDLAGAKADKPKPLAKAPRRHPQPGTAPVADPEKWKRLGESIRQLDWLFDASIQNALEAFGSDLPIRMFLHMNREAIRRLAGQPNRDQALAESLNSSGQVDDRLMVLARRAAEMEMALVDYERIRADLLSTRSGASAAEVSACMPPAAVYLKYMPREAS
jgi:hypothetical protein